VWKLERNILIINIWKYPPLKNDSKQNGKHIRNIVKEKNRWVSEKTDPVYTIQIPSAKLWNRVWSGIQPFFVDYE
jgi:hypothetical protein